MRVQPPKMMKTSMQPLPDTDERHTALNRNGHFFQQARDAFERARADYERIRFLCAQQREMIAEQLAFLRQSNHNSPLTTDSTIAQGEENSYLGLSEDIRVENRLLAAIPEPERERLKPYLELVFLEFNQVLVEFDQPISYVYFPQTTITSTVVQTPDGEMIEVGLMGTEGVVGLSLLYGVERSNATVIVQNPGQAIRMKAVDFRRHVTQRGGPFLELLLRYANYFNVMVQHHAACNAAHPLEGRMCRWILLTHDRVESDQFPLTQDFLALMLGVRRPTVSDVARKLKGEGLINYTRGTITVTHRQGLESRSCECYQLIKEQIEHTFDGITARAGRK